VTSTSDPYARRSSRNEYPKVRVDAEALKAAPAVRCAWLACAPTCPWFGHLSFLATP